MMAEIRNYTMNFGPQHPAAHGCYAVVLELDGRSDRTHDPHIDCCIAPRKNWPNKKLFIQSVPYMDRLTMCP